jgi:hypothetical protein
VARLRQLYTFGFLLILLTGLSPVFAQFTLTNVGAPHGVPSVNPIRPIARGHFVFAANGNYGSIVAFDISDPANPIKISAANLGGDYAYDLAVSGNIAFVAQQAAGLCIFDISNPTNMIGLSQTNAGDLAVGVAASGSYAYVVYYPTGLRIYNVSNPAVPAIVSTITNGHPVQVAISGNYAYVSDTQLGFVIYNVSNPYAPVQVGQPTNHFWGGFLLTAHNYLYIEDQSGGIAIYDASNPANPLYLSHTDTNLSVSPSFISGNFLYARNPPDSLRVYDVSSPALPREVGYTRNYNGAPVSHAALSSDYLYLASGAYGLIVFRVTGPSLHLDFANPDLVVSWPTNTLPFALQKSTTLTLPDWIAVTNTPQVVADRNHVLLPQAASNAFFRLSLTNAP